MHAPPWTPDEIHIVTTTFALADIRRELQSPEGHLAALFDGRVPPVSTHIPCHEGHAVTIAPWLSRGEYETTKVTELADVNTESGATLMGAFGLTLLAGAIDILEVALLPKTAPNEWTPR